MYKFIALLIATLFAATHAQNIKMGFIYGNPPDDLSWVYAIDLGRHYVEFSRSNVKTSYAAVSYYCDNITIAAMETYANRSDYQIIVVTSDVYVPCMLDIAAKHPEKYFLEVGSTGVGSNIASMLGRMQEGRYIQGIIAGSITKTKKIGFIDSVPGSGMWDANAVLLGARKVCPDCVIIHHYLGDYYVPDLDAYTTEYMITQENVDVIITLQDAFDHFAVAEKYGIPIFGFDSDQGPLAPDVVVMSAYWNWGPMLLKFADMIANNSFQPQFLNWGFRENGIDITDLNINFVNTSLATLVSQEIQLLISNEMINGTSYIFCGALWKQLAPSNVSSCLTQDEINNMNYFITGVNASGILTIPIPPKGDPAWPYIVGGLAGGFGLIIIIAIVIYLILYQKYHLLFIPKNEDNPEWGR